MSEIPINGDMKVILTHIQYIRDDIKEVQELLKKDNARLNELETGRAVMVENIKEIKRQNNIFSSISSGLAAFLAMAAAFLMRKI